MSFFLVALYFAAILLALRIFYLVLRARWKEIKLPLLKLASICAIVYAAFLAGALIHNYRLFGTIVFNKGKIINQSYCCEGFPPPDSDGIEFVVYSGEPTEYMSLVNRLVKSDKRLPTEALNINGFGISEAWQPCAEAFQKHPSALDFMQQRNSNVSALISATNSICAFNYDGNQIDFWLLEPSKAIFFEYSNYS